MLTQRVEGVAWAYTQVYGARDAIIERVQPRLGYDSAGAGALNGCQAQLASEVPQAIYYHCSSHQLNLALSKACCVLEIAYMIFTLKSLGIYFNSLHPERH